MSLPPIAWPTVAVTIIILMFVIPFVQSKLASR